MFQHQSRELCHREHLGRRVWAHRSPHPLRIRLSCPLAVVSSRSFLASMSPTERVTGRSLAATGKNPHVYPFSADHENLDLERAQQGPEMTETGQSHCTCTLSPLSTRTSHECLSHRYSLHDKGECTVINGVLERVLAGIISNIGPRRATMKISEIKHGGSEWTRRRHSQKEMSTL